jgi:murein endopeptidase
MRLFVGLVVASGLLISSAAQAKPADDDASGKAKRHKAELAKHDHKADKKAKPGANGKGHAAARITATRGRDERIAPRLIGHGQSIGEPWAGRLQHPTELPPGAGYVIRRPYRAFGTESTIALVERAIHQTLAAFPDEHVLAIGDISAETGGPISQHRSHQAGRDIDVGLFYTEQPDDYPANFVHADEDNLDCAATFKLLQSFVATQDDDGGVQMIFLDFDVQGILYHWALDHGFSEARLDRIFQYPHGRGSSEGIVRHVAGHDNHMHVRFRCQDSDTSCGDDRGHTLPRE